MPKIPTGSGGDAGTTVDIPTISADSATIETIMSTVYFWSGIVAVLVIVIAGFFYVTANGDSNQVQRAKNAILGAVIGLVVIMAAFTITQLVVYLGQSS